MSKPRPPAALVARPTPFQPWLAWPAPALLAWAAGWLGWLALGRAGLAPGMAFAVGWLVGLPLAAMCQGRWRRLIAAAGFPLSALILGAGHAVPAWAWLLPMLALLAAYPVRAWRDAPFFPTARGALHGLDAITGAPRSALDAGCGLGHGLAELHRLWPQADLLGVEWSPPLALLAWLRARVGGWSARVRIRRGDMWTLAWSGHDLVYLFQRPESMAGAWAKALRELAPGAWLVSLEFEVPDVKPWASLKGPGRRTVWIYRLPRKIEDSTTGAAGR